MSSAIETALYFLVPILGVSALATYLFGRWINSHSGMTGEIQIKSWEVFGKNITVLVGIISGTLLLVKYLDEKNIAENQMVCEKKIEFKQKQVATELVRHNEYKLHLGRARTVAAQIANSRATPQSEKVPGKLLLKFDTLYYADLIGIEGSKVASSMINYRNQLEKADVIATNKFHALTLRLSESVKEELEDSKKKLDEIRKELSDLASRNCT